jgi:hypothetical protein
VHVREKEGIITGLLHYFVQIISSMEDTFNSSCQEAEIFFSLHSFVQV